MVVMITSHPKQNKNGDVGGRSASEQAIARIFDHSTNGTSFRNFLATRQRGPGMDRIESTDAALTPPLAARSSGDLRSGTVNRPASPSRKRDRDHVRHARPCADGHHASL